MTTNGVLTMLADFDGTNGNGSLPQPTLILGSDSNFYGTCYHGGNEDNGTVFRLTTNGLMTVLVDFNGMKGSSPNGLVLGPDGNFYGTTAWGGSSNLGTVFRLTTDGQLLTLASFTEQIHSTGANPMAGLVLGRDGNFYGTTSQGGLGWGTVFKVAPDGSLTKLADFDHINGANPEDFLVQGDDGDFYGTTKNGGSGGSGTVFQVTTNGVLTALVSLPYTVSWTYQGGLVLGNDGTFYGTTFGDNGPVSTNFGSVFKVTANGVLTRLVEFTGTNGANPVTGLVLATDGNLYGTTFSDEPGGGGTIFRFVMLRLSGMARQPAGSFLLTGAGPPNEAYRLWAGTDFSLPFTSWMHVTNGCFDSDGNLSCTDDNAATHSSRFYRISVP